MGNINRVVESEINREELLKNIECPICFEVPLPPIFNCQNGHAICKMCKTKIDYCAICRKSITNFRNYPLEAIINSLYFNCRFADNGCKAENIKGDLFETHLNKCEHRDVICNEKRTIVCNHKKIPYNQFQNHIEVAHGIQGDKCDTDGDILISKSYFIKSWDKGNDYRNFERILNFKYFDGHFFMVKLGFCRGNVCIYLTVQGTEELAKKYTVKFSTSSNSNDMQVEWTLPVFSFRNTFEEITMSKIIAIPIENFSQLIAQSQKNDMKFKITNISQTIFTSPFSTISSALFTK